MTQILGTDASDSLVGGPGAEAILAGGGDDVVRGGAGDDALYGGDGADVLSGDDGSDLVYGEGGDDLLTGAYPSDFTLDRLYGGDGNDQILVGQRDEAHGGAGDDLFELASQQDFVAAPAIIYGDDGQDVVNLVAANAFLTVYLDTIPPAGSAGVQIYDVELILLGDRGAHVIGGSRADGVIGGAGTDSIDGGAGDDVLAGLGGRDTLDGGAGDDLMDGGPGDDRLDGGAGFDRVDYSAAPGGVTIDLSRQDGQVTGFGEDTLIGIEGLVGTPYDDVFSGGAGPDVIYASAGADRFDGRDGVNTLSMAGFAHDYALSLSGGAGTVAGGREGGSDTLTSVENVQFLGGTLTFDTGSTAAQIVRLYDSFLGRAPDAAGFQSYLRFVQAGHSFQDMADNAAASPEFASATAGLTDAQYITYVYEHSLHREPDAYGLQQYEQALHDGTLTRTSMIVQAAESPEHVALTAPLVAQGLWMPDEKVESLELLYDAAVQRQPDATGIAGYSAEVAAGTSYRQIANQMASSAEFQAAHAGQTDAQYVDSLYVAEVGRHADPTGLAAYTDQLAHGYSRGDILWETAFSAEHQGHVLAYSDPLLG